MNFLLPSLISLTIMATRLFGQDDSVLLDIAKKGFEARESAGGILNKKASVPAFRKPFEGLEDSQKIKAIIQYLYYIDQSDSELSMSASSNYDSVCALSDDHDFIKDWSSLRKTLQNERDSRKFYLLSNLVSMSKNGAQYDFIAERTHMLFADGRVAKREGEYTREYANDVSMYAYRAIVGNLRVLGADFEPPPKNLTHEEQAKILAQWLKVNWPGCENLEIPENVLGASGRPQKSLTPELQAPSRAQESEGPQKSFSRELQSPPRAQEKLPDPPQSQEKKTGNHQEEIPLAWILAGVVSTGILALLFKVWKVKSVR